MSDSWISNFVQILLKIGYYALGLLYRMEHLFYSIFYKFMMR